MSHNVETMAYTNETPWHGLGHRVDNKQTVDSMMKAAKINWSVEKQPIFLEDGTQIDDRFALTRSTDNRVLDLCSSSYTPHQNRELFKFFDEYVKAGDAYMETAGSLRNGQLVWGLANLNADTSAMTMFQTSLETVSKLEDRLIKKYGIKLSLTGKSPVTISMIKVEESQRRNGVAKTVIQEITDWADKTGTTLTLTPTDEYGIRKSVLERFYERNGFVSNSGRNKDFSISESMIRLPIKSTHDVKNDAAMFSLFGNVVGKKLTKKDQLDNAWGLLNGVTYWTDHVASRTADKRLANAWLGKTNKQKSKILSSLMELI